jgi:hypothetical protein
VRKPGVQLAQELFIHGDRQQFLTCGALIWHIISIHRFAAGKNKIFVDMFIDSI